MVIDSSNSSHQKDEENPSGGGNEVVEDVNATKESFHKENAPVLDVVTTWSEGTSIHGVPYALKHEQFFNFFSPRMTKYP